MNKYMKQKMKNILLVGCSFHNSYQMDYVQNCFSWFFQYIRFVFVVHILVYGELRIDRNGADVRGYFVWSLMDDLEWTGGFYHVWNLLR